MKIAIISDVHGNLANLHKVLNFLDNNKISILISLGDFGGKEEYQEIQETYTGKFYFVWGNVEQDFNTDEKQELVKELKISNKRIGLTHFPKLINKMIENKKYDYVLFGHTHIPSKKIINNTIILNPGTVAGVYSLPTFAVIDLTSKQETLIGINNL